MEWDEALKGLLTALGIGLLVGVVRERAHGLGVVAKAGIRTHALIAVLGAVTWGLGANSFFVTLVVVGALAVSGYLKTADADPGMTGEVAIVLTFVLGALAREQRTLASALGVVVAILLYVKKPLQHFTRDLISDRELEDVLVFAAVAVVVWPLIPELSVDPWGVVDLNLVMRLVVLVMAVGMVGHIAQRTFGVRFGMAVAGFFSGFVSSTVAVASLGARVKETPTLVGVASAGAILANLASLMLMTAVIAAASPQLMRDMLFALLASAGVLLLTAWVCFLWSATRIVLPETLGSRAFKLSHAISIAMIITAVMILTAWLKQQFGVTGALVTAGFVALVELHAAAASIAQLNASDALEPNLAHRGVLIVMASASLAKSGLAFVSGGLRYGLCVSASLMAGFVAALAVTWIS